MKENDVDILNLSSQLHNRAPPVFRSEHVRTHDEHSLSLMEEIYACYLGA